MRKILARIYDFLWCLTLVVPMAWRLTSDDWDLTISTNGFTARRPPSMEPKA